MSGDRLANLFIWFDNEWGFANRMLEVAAYWGKGPALAGSVPAERRRGAWATRSG